MLFKVTTLLKLGQDEITDQMGIKAHTFGQAFLKLMYDDALHCTHTKLMEVVI